MEFQLSNKIKSLKPSAIREILKYSSDSSVISFAAGNPSPEAFPIHDIQQITAYILEKNPIAALQYSISEGYAPLREMVKEKLLTKVADYDDVIIVSGAQQGIELVCKCLCNEGDTVICENPTFIGSLNSFRSYNVNLVGVDMEDDGISTDKLEKALLDNPNTKFIYLIPNFQNPTGITMSSYKRQLIYTMAQKHDVCIVEDDPYGNLRFSGENIPAIKTYDTEGRVIYCGSFSKILSPGLRVGFVLAQKTLIGKLTVAKQCSDVHTNMLSQMICHAFLEQTDMPEHYKKLQSIYRHKSSLMLSEIDKHFPKTVSYIRPEGGLFIWCNLPAHINMIDFCTRAVRDYKVALVPGNAFNVNESDYTNSFRLNFSTPTDEQIIKGIKILGGLLNE